MAKKTRKVLKQQSQQRAIQQAVTNVNTTNQEPVPAKVEPVKAAAPARAVKSTIDEEQEFGFVKSDVRRSLTLASVFMIIMIGLSLFIH